MRIVKREGKPIPYSRVAEGAVFEYDKGFYIKSNLYIGDNNDNSAVNLESGICRKVVETEMVLVCDCALHILGYLPGGDPE